MQSKEEIVRELEEIFDRALNIGVSDIGQIKLVQHYYKLLKEKKENDKIRILPGDNSGLSYDCEKPWLA